MKNICVYCGSSNDVNPEHLDLARSLGQALATNGFGLVYGGGHNGLMGQAADGALEKKGTVTGVIPTFMKEREWAHLGLTELVEVETMAERKDQFYNRSDAFITLPGGTGTFEELFETTSLKKLGLLSGEILILNHGGFYDDLLRFMDKVIAGGYLPGGETLWAVTTTVEETVAKLQS